LILEMFNNDEESDIDIVKNFLWLLLIKHLLKLMT
jgi:hypothetical protein